MRRPVPRPLALLSLLVPAALGGCALPQLDVAPRYTLASLSGDFGVNSGSVTSRADLEEMGLDDSEGIPGVRADLKWGLPHLILSAAQSDYSGTGRLTAELNQGGQTITAGTMVESDLDLALYSGLLVWDLFPGKTFELGAGFGASLVDFDMRITDPGASTTLQADEVVPVPLVAVNAGVHVGSLEVALLVSGASLSLDDSKGSYIDADGFLRWKLFGGKNHVRSSLILGWRELAIDVEYEDDGDEVEVDVDLSGPYVSLEITL